VTARLHVVISLQSFVPRADHSVALMPLSAAPPLPTYEMLIHYRRRRLPSDWRQNIVLPRTSRKRIAQFPISPDIGEYRPIPITPIPVSFEPELYLGKKWSSDTELLPLLTWPVCQSLSQPASTLADIQTGSDSRQHIIYFQLNSKLHTTVVHHLSL